MNSTLIVEDFRNRVCDGIDVRAEGTDRFRVTTPFRFGDGDHFGIVLKRDGDRWILTDEAHTMMHLSYWLNEKELATGNRHEIIHSALSGFFVEDRGGELIIPITNEHYGNALFNFVQAISQGLRRIVFIARARPFYFSGGFARVYSVRDPLGTRHV